MGNVAAILLAAGESTRMGQLKALLPWQGTTLLEHQVEAFRQAGVSRVVVVLGHRKDELVPLVEGLPGVEWALNPHYRQGKTTSLKAGLAALGQHSEKDLLLLNVDQPRSDATISQVLTEHQRSGCLISIPCYRDKGGHPVALSTSLVPEMLLVSEETLGLKAVMRRHKGETLRLEMDSPEVLLDLNTPEDYQRALQLVTG